MGIVLNDLAVLEDGVGSDYSSVTIDYKWLLNELNHRLTTLKNRKGDKKMGDWK